jgi:GPI-anchor transamidase subunit U
MVAVHGGLYWLCPVTVLTCAARSLAPWGFVLQLLCATFAQKRFALVSGAFFALAVYFDGPAVSTVLVVPVLISWPNTMGARIRCLCSFALTLFALLGPTSTWSSFVYPAYLWVFSYPDGRPNPGMWWYFMTETFDTYRAYFLLVLHSFTYMCAPLLAVNLAHRPAFLVCAGWGVLHTFQPYPELFHTSTTLILVLVHPQFALAVPFFSGLFLVLCFSSLLQPVMLHTWLNLRSGNANYYYFQCLIANGMVCAVLLQWIKACVERDETTRRIILFLDARKQT